MLLALENDESKKATLQKQHNIPVTICGGEHIEICVKAYFSVEVDLFSDEPTLFNFLE